MADWFPIAWGSFELNRFELSPAGELRKQRKVATGSRSQKLDPITKQEAALWWREECKIMKSEIDGPADLVNPFISAVSYDWRDGVITRHPIEPRNPPVVRWLCHEIHRQASLVEDEIVTTGVAQVLPPEWIDLVGDPEYGWYGVRRTDPTQSSWQYSVFHGPSLGALLASNESIDANTLVM